jgi:hypothetical protein
MSPQPGVPVLRQVVLTPLTSEPSRSSTVGYWTSSTAPVTSIPVLTRLTRAGRTG